MDDDSGPKLVPPYFPPPPKLVARILAFVIGFVLAQAAIVIAVHIYKPASLAGTLSAQALPTELRSAVFLSRTGSGSDAFVAGSLWYSRLPYSGGDILSYSNRNGSAVTVEHAQDYRILENGSVMMKGTEPLALPALSPTSRVIAFARMTGESAAAAPAQAKAPPALIAAANPAEWSIDLYLPSAKASTRVASGYAPLFLDDSTLIFFTGTGIYRYNTVTGKSDRLLDERFPSVIAPVLQSPDRSLIAFRDSRGSTRVYRIAEGGMAALMTVGSPLHQPALSNDALYDLVGTKKGGEVWKYPFDGSAPQLVYTFPVSLAISRIVF